MPIRMGAGGHAGKQVLQTLKDLHNIVPHVWQWLQFQLQNSVILANSGKIE